MNRSNEMVQWFIKNGADIELQDNTGRTAYSFAIDKGFKGVTDILVSAGVKQVNPKYMDIPGDIYFGLHQPGLTAELFAPGIITTEIGEHGTVAISPIEDEIYWEAGSIKFIKKVNGRWTFPDTLPIFQKYQASNPAFSADGKKLFFHSPMSLNKDGKFKDLDLWYVQKTSDGWSEPENLGPEVNSQENEQMPSIAKNGNIYFSVGGDIYMSTYRDGKYEARKKLSQEINTDEMEDSPCIAPDESFLIYESRRARRCLLISFKQNNGSWSQPVTMGENICRGMARFPGLSPDGKFLFFNSLRTGWLDIYWVSAKIIEELRPKE
jgi:hypothetical protein